MRYQVKYGNHFVSGTGPLRFSTFETDGVLFNEQRKNEVVALLELYAKNDSRARAIKVKVCGTWSEANEEQSNSRMERK